METLQLLTQCMVVSKARKLDEKVFHQLHAPPPTPCCSSCIFLFLPGTLGVREQHLRVPPAKSFLSPRSPTCRYISQNFAKAEIGPHQALAGYPKLFSNIGQVILLESPCSVDSGDMCLILIRAIGTPPAGYSHTTSHTV